MTSELLRDKFKGALLGTLVGDAVGAPVEGWDEKRLNHALETIAIMPKGSPERAQQESLFGLITEPDYTPPGSARYTDDTQMMIGVAESLAICGEFDGAHMASRFATNFQAFRGYGGAAYGIMMELRRGEPWNEVGGRIFDGQGSFGNGGAMRVAPVGVFAYDNDELLRTLAKQQAAITHIHPLGFAGAELQAAAVAAACRRDPSEPFDAHEFLEEVERLAPSLPNAYLSSLAQVHKLIDNPEPPWTVAERLGSSIEAQRSVPAAIYSFLRLPQSFEAAVKFAVRLGDDTDTVGAMCGAISGAYHGASVIPQKWLFPIENGTKGRDYISELADRLFDRYELRRAGIFGEAKEL